MILRVVSLAAALAATPVFAQPAAQPAQQPAQPAVDPSHLFGVRESVQQIDISPDGRRVVFLQPGTARGTGVYVHELDSTPSRDSSSIPTAIPSASAGATSSPTTA